MIWILFYYLSFFRVHVIRDLSTKATSDRMGDEMERFAWGEKLRLSDQRQNYKQRIQEIWRRQIAALSSVDAGNELAERSDSALGSSTKDASGADASDEGKEKVDNTSDSSDDDEDDDDFGAMLEMDMLNAGKANMLTKEHGDHVVLRDSVRIPWNSQHYSVRGKRSERCKRALIRRAVEEWVIN